MTAASMRRRGPAGVARATAAGRGPRHRRSVALGVGWLAVALLCAGRLSDLALPPEPPPILPELAGAATAATTAASADRDAPRSDDSRRRIDVIVDPPAAGPMPWPVAEVDLDLDTDIETWSELGATTFDRVDRRHDRRRAQPLPPATWPR